MKIDSQSLTFIFSWKQTKELIKTRVPRALWFIPARILTSTQYSIRHFKKLASLEYCPAILPWFSFQTSSSDINKVHYLSQTLSPNFSKNNLAFCFLWPLISVISACKSTLIYGRYVQQEYRVSLWRQVSEQVLLANRYNISSSSYYAFKLFQPENRLKADLFVQHHEICVSLPHLNQGLDCGKIGDKLRFFENARQKNLPVPPVVAAFRNNQILQWFEENPGQLPKVDLVVKPTRIYCGIGVECWKYHAETDVWFWQNQRLSQEGLIQHCEALAEKGTYILQCCVQNHPDLRPLAGNGVCTLRVVTYQQHEDAHLLLASFRMPQSNSFVDNLAAGGIAAPVNRDTGILGPGVSKDLRFGIFHSHPNSASPITDCKLPCWEETVELSRQAHRYFPEFPFIGWDIIITESGPVLLEANLTWCVHLLQIPHNKALGETPFSEVFLEHLESKCTS